MRGYPRDRKIKWWFRLCALTGKLSKAEAEAHQLDAQTKKLEVETRRVEVETEKLVAEAGVLSGQARKTGLENWHLQVGLLGKLVLVGAALGALVAVLVLAIVDPSRLTEVGEVVLKALGWLLK